MTSKRSLTILAAIAFVFGSLTVFSGGRALFGDEAARASVGEAVDFVLWFNILAGFLYIGAGAAFLKSWRCSLWLAAFIAFSTAAVAMAFGVHVAGGGAYEVRTVGALALRLTFWLMVFAAAWRKLGR
ncbi:hypothetical protein [Rhodoferax sp. PAMC 29310]|uniref:hypothetical protein n=1 Tax=Rhodoferax sp. PAMC 29310 TaxID=2822760 RepID=UPI001B331602|nr:hypothetical protein [Rhodoferax sp. PAMC 29310]